MGFLICSCALGYTVSGKFKFPSAEDIKKLGAYGEGLQGGCKAMFDKEYMHFMEDGCLDVLEYSVLTRVKFRYHEDGSVAKGMVG